MDTTNIPAYGGAYVYRNCYPYSYINIFSLVIQAILWFILIVLICYLLYVIYKKLHIKYKAMDLEAKSRNKKIDEIYEYVKAQKENKPLNNADNLSKEGKEEKD